MDQRSFLEGLTFKVADASERLRALELVSQVFAEDVGHFAMDEFDAEANYFVALEASERVIATFRLVGPRQRPFDLERLINLPDFVAAGRSPGLVGRLCVHRDYRTVSRKILLPMCMLKLAHLFCRKHGITDLLLYTGQHLVNLYKGAYFRVLEPVVEHPQWGRVRVMHLDLLEFWSRHRESRQPVARFLLRTDLPNFRI